MNAFGKRGGVGGVGQRANFGVARPMKGGGGDQFPALDEAAPKEEALPTAEPLTPRPSAASGSAMA